MHLRHAIGVVVLMGSISTSSMTGQSTATTAKQPAQPAKGPGGSEAFAHAIERVKISDGGKGGWLFLPSTPIPAKAPVVIFCHGWSAILPRGYEAWIDHLVMQGNIVLWPNYQDSLRTPTAQFVPNAVAAVKAGLEMLRSAQSATHPDLDRVAAVGHSAGGMVAAGIAVRAAAEGLPKIRALMPVEPGDSQRGGMASVPLADMSTLPSDTLLLVLVGQEDTTVGTYDGERIFHESVAVPALNKSLLMLRSDDHGLPALVANHYTPAAMVDEAGSWRRQPFRPASGRNTIDIGVVDTLDYNGTWRLLDRLLEAAFDTTQKGRLFQDSSLLLMGSWSDGIPIKALTRLQ